MKKPIAALVRTFSVLAVSSCLILFGLVAWRGWAALPGLLRGHVLWSDAPLWIDLLVPTVFLSLFAWAFRSAEERSDLEPYWTFLGLGDFGWTASIVFGFLLFDIGTLISGPAWGTLVMCGFVAAVPIVLFTTVYSVQYVLIPAWKLLCFAWCWMLGG